MLPSFLIIGAMKCGTTSLANYLADHPDVFVAAEKELHFFNLRWDRGTGWYEQQFAGAGACAAAGEATPEYLFDAEAQARMASVVPGARLIVLLRNPVDRAYSHYGHRRHREGEARTFAQCVEADLTGRAAPGYTTPEPYVRKGHYAQQLERLCTHYAREQILVVLYDDLVRAPADTYRRVCRFLGVDATVVPASVGTVRNANREVRWPLAYRALARSQATRVLPAAAGQALYWRLTRPAPAPPPMPADVRARLDEHYAPHDRALSEWLGRDLPWRAAEPLSAALPSSS